MKSFTEEKLNSIWKADPDQTEATSGGDIVDVPGDDLATAVRHANELVQMITIQTGVQTYSDYNNDSTEVKYSRSRSTPEASWGRWQSEI